MSHTPGPWTACNDGKCKCKLVSSENHPVAQVIAGEWGDEYPDVRLVEREGSIGKHAEAYVEKIVYGAVDPAFARANARLIAAAPGLLTALKAWASFDWDTLMAAAGGEPYSAQYEWGEVQAMTDAAIAKVRGDEWPC